MSHDRIENLPFTTYDLVGYLVPGGIIILYVLPYLEYDGGAVLQILQHATWPIQVLILTAIVVFSYITGHIISYLSSEFSEKFVLRLLGYPTHFLLIKRDVKAKIRENLKKIFSRETDEPIPLFTILVVIFHFVITPPLLCIYCFMGLDVYAKPMSKGASEACRERFQSLWPNANIDFENGEQNWFELVSYYTLNKYPYVAPKAYNYVVLYGLLRSMFFISTIVCWLLVIEWFFLDVGMKPIIDFFQEKWIAFVVFEFLTVCWGIAYCKFFKRYSKEILSTFAAMYVATERPQP